jgi:hypothetical protein
MTRSEPHFHAEEEPDLAALLERQRHEMSWLAAAERVTAPRRLHALLPRLAEPNVTRDARPRGSANPAAG